MDMAKKRNFKRQTERLLIKTQNNALWILYIKAKIDKALQNRKCWL